MKIKYNPNTMFVYPVTEDKLNQVVSKLQGKSATGFDQIPEFLVKECIQYIKKPLIFIFNVSINQDIFADLMKIAKIRPIFKKGDGYDTSNYVLSFFTKILEKQIYNRLILFISKHNILTDAERGFRDNKSTEMASHIFIENILESTDKQLYVLGLLFDLTKAYDTINNEILLNILEYYGIRGTLKSWIKFYLLYWSQFVEIFKTDNIRRNQKIYEALFKEIKH